MVARVGNKQPEDSCLNPAKMRPGQSRTANGTLSVEARQLAKMNAIVIDGVVALGISFAVRSAAAAKAP